MEILLKSVKEANTTLLPVAKKKKKVNPQDPEQDPDQEYADAHRNLARDPRGNLALEEH